MLDQEKPLAVTEVIEMLKVSLLVCLLIPKVCYAVEARPGAKIYLYGVISIFSVGVVGIECFGQK